MSPAERNQIDAAMANRAMTGVLGKGYGAMSPADRFLSGREKLRGKGMGAITHAEAAQAATTPVITPVQRRAMNNETMMGGKPGDYAKGGAAKKSSVVKNPKKAMGGMMHSGYAKGGKPRC